MSDFIEMYWWRGAGNKNFGDVLGPALVNHFTKKEIIFAEPEHSSLVTIGSISEHLPNGYEGTLAGIGMARSKTRKNFANADVLAVRGRLTLDRINTTQEPILADPGLIAIDLVKDLNLEKRYDCGIISHYSDHTRYSFSNSININILSPIEDVIMQAAQCKNIISSSLHGIVLADALGVPRMWKKYNRVQGNGFKFEDYASSIGGILRPNVWKLANRYVVKQKQDQLREIFSCL